MTSPTCCNSPLEKASEFFLRKGMEEFEVVVSTLRMVKTGGKGLEREWLWFGQVWFPGLAVSHACNPLLLHRKSKQALVMENEWMERVIPQNRLIPTRFRQRESVL
jgi:hypothetical protein